MNSALSKACTIKFLNFEGPFDLLFHLIEKNQFNIYDIPISLITDQYMEYLFNMQQMDLEVASEFLVMAATLLHIKTRMLLPDKKEKLEEEPDPREDLIIKLVLYKKYKEIAMLLKSRENQWNTVYYKLPEVIDFKYERESIDLCPIQLASTYFKIIDRNRRKMNVTVAAKFTQIIQHEKVSIKSKMKELLKSLIDKVFVRFDEIFSLRFKSRTEVVTGFLAMLQLAKIKRVTIEQSNMFTDILIYQCDEGVANISNMDMDKVASFMDEVDDEKENG